MKDELGGKIMKEFAILRPKTYSYLMDDGNGDRKAKGPYIKYVGGGPEGFCRGHEII